MTKQWDVGRLLSVSSSYWSGCALHAAVRLRLFTIIEAGCAIVSDIAEQAKTDPRATGLLLDALVALGLLEKVDDRYYNTTFASNCLVIGGPGYMGHIVLHHHHILDGWAQLDCAVRSGQKVERRSYGEGVERESFLMGMFNLAMGIAPKIAQTIDLSGKKKFLDLGGGPGTYVIQFCLANPSLSGVVFDRPTTEPFARETIEKFKLSDRIDFVGGDFTTDSLEDETFDVVWLSHVLHSNSKEECSQIVENTIRALVPGGTVLIHDFILDESKTDPEFAALFSLNMLVGTEGGRSYSRREIVSMLDNCGVVNTQQHFFDSPNGSSIISGVKEL